MRCGCEARRVFPADFHDLGKGMILEPPAIAEEAFCSAACIMMVGM